MVASAVVTAAPATIPPPVPVTAAANVAGSTETGRATVRVAATAANTSFHRATGLSHRYTSVPSSARSPKAAEAKTRAVTGASRARE